MAGGLLRGPGGLAGMTTSPLEPSREKDIQRVPTQQLLGQEVFDQAVIGRRMFKEQQMTGFRNELQPRAFEQAGNLAHGVMSTCIFFAADEKYGIDAALIGSGSCRIGPSMAKGQYSCFG